MKGLCICSLRTKWITNEDQKALSAVQILFSMDHRPVTHKNLMIVNRFVCPLCARSGLRRTRKLRSPWSNVQIRISLGIVLGTDVVDRAPKTDRCEISMISCVPQQVTGFHKIFPPSKSITIKTQLPHFLAQRPFANQTRLRCG